MITLTLAPPGWTWRHNDEELRWELGFYRDDLSRNNPWGYNAWITDDMIENVEPDIVVIMLQRFAEAAVQSKERW